ncbi:MAG: YqjF family protein [Myxococcaceae bacterium]
MRIEMHPNRQFPPPRAPPLMHMRWKSLLFMHWRLDPEQLRPHVPSSLTLETFDGSAWLGIVPFLMTETYGMPEAPIKGALSKAMGAYQFPELNVRTYVSVGGKPGVFFFSLDAASRSAVRLARTGFRLAYFDARMELLDESNAVHFKSERTDPRGAPASFHARYRPIGEVKPPEPGTLESFLTDRYALYTTVLDRPLRAHIHHAPWPLQRAEVDVAALSMTPFLPRVTLSAKDALCHYAADQEVVAWPVVPAMG